MERQRPFHEEGFTDDESAAVVRRAVELQQRAAGRIPRQALEQSAEDAGVAPEFVQQAIAELRAQQTARAQGVAPRPAASRRLAIVAALVAMIIAFLLAARISYQGAPSATPAVEAPVATPVEVNPPLPPQPARPLPPPRR